MKRPNDSEKKRPAPLLTHVLFAFILLAGLAVSEDLVVSAMMWVMGLVGLWAGWSCRESSQSPPSSRRSLAEEEDRPGDPCKCRKQN